MNPIRLKKIGSEIVRQISDILLNETNDSLLKTITITGCDVSNDLSYAKVYFTSITDMDTDKLEKEMEEASSYIRMKLADAIDLRHTPRLRFVYDKSIAYGDHIEEILNKIHEKEE